MRDPKEIYMEEHARLVDEAVEAGMSESAAYEATADAAYAAMTDRYADLLDQARELALSAADERALRAAAHAEYDHDGGAPEGREAYADALVDSARK